MSTFNKLSLRSSSYVAVIGCSPRLTEEVSKSVRSTVSVCKDKVSGIRNLNDIGDLDTSAFDRVLIKWTDSDTNSLPECIRVCEPLGLVMLSGVSVASKNSLIAYLERKGIFEHWFSHNNKFNGDLVFKTKKYHKSDSNDYCVN